MPRLSQIPVLGPIARDLSILTQALTARISPPPSPEEFPRSESHAQVRAWLAASAAAAAADTPSPPFQQEDDYYYNDDDFGPPAASTYAPQYEPLRPRRRHSARESRRDRYEAEVRGLNRAASTRRGGATTTRDRDRDRDAVGAALHALSPSPERYFARSAAERSSGDRPRRSARTSRTWEREPIPARESSSHRSHRYAS